jgi:exodeoxyribonuclease V alpha subunit
MTDSPALLDVFSACTADGRLRRLGPAFARFIASLGETSPSVLVGCVLLSELEGRGHSCLILDDLAADPCGLLGWTQAQWDELCDAAGALPASAHAWQEALAACPYVWTPQTGGAQDGADASSVPHPLVLAHDRLYLRRYWNDESFVARAIAARTATAADCAARGADPGKVRAWIDRLFAGADPDDGHNWQKTACAIAVRGALAVITGGPGTGKTYTVARLLALLFALASEPEKLRVAMAAPSGKAAVRLKQSIDGALASLSPDVVEELDLKKLVARMAAATTLHSLLGFSPDTRAIRRNADNPLEVDVLIVDEASMVHLEMMADLLDALPPSATLVLLGDMDQFASVEAGAVLGDICHGAAHGNYLAATADFVMQTTGQHFPETMLGAGDALAQQTVMLRKSRRNGAPIGDLALAVNAGETAKAQACLRAGGMQAPLYWAEKAQLAALVACAVHGRSAEAGGYRSYLDVAKQGPATPDAAAHVAWVKAVMNAFDAFRLLCAVREGEWGVAGINRAVEEALQALRLIDRRGEWYAGRPVMVTRNDHELGIYNGDVGITLPDAGGKGQLRVYFLRGDEPASVLPARLANVETAFAMTVHKVQGSEFRHAALVLPKDSGQIVSRELFYTAITRASKCFSLFTPDAAVVGEAVKRRTRRASGLRRLLNPA